MLFASLVGGMINIPISGDRVVVQQMPRGLMRFFYYYPPAVRERVIAIGVDDIQRAARQYLKPDRLSVVLVGNARAFVNQRAGAQSTCPGLVSLGTNPRK